MKKYFLSSDAKELPTKLYDKLYEKNVSIEPLTRTCPKINFNPSIHIVDDAVIIKFYVGDYGCVGIGTMNLNLDRFNSGYRIVLRDDLKEEDINKLEDYGWLSCERFGIK